MKLYIPCRMTSQVSNPLIMGTVLFSRIALWTLTLRFSLSISLFEFAVAKKFAIPGEMFLDNSGCTSCYSIIDGIIVNISDRLIYLPREFPPIRAYQRSPWTDERPGEYAHTALLSRFADFSPSPSLLSASPLPSFVLSIGLGHRMDRAGLAAIATREGR
jgi:hypothetical protein